jgi:DNA-binding transcriptional regulator LsrR (DeoR family)
MKKIVDDERMMLRVCDLYYNRDISQSDIAKLMGISRPTVAKLLQSAKQKEIVKIIICDPQERGHSELERRLENLYKLQEVIVVDTVEEDRQKDALGKATAAYLKSVMKDGFKVGVAMGTTLRYIAPYGTKQFRDLTFVPMMGGSGDIDLDLHANHIVELMAKAYGGDSMHLYAPALVSRVQTKRELLKEESVRRVTDQYNHLDVALMGIGTGRESSTVLSSGYYTEEMRANVHSSGACGDICMQLYDKDGDLDVVEYNKYVIGISPTKLKQVPYAVGIAGGVHKAEAIRGAIQGRYINVLITDQKCAEELYRLGGE